MKKKGILNSEISKVLSDLGHTDTICIADCGLPCPEGVKKIDVALTYGVRSFLEVVLDDMAVEAITLAKEIMDENPELLKEVKQLLKDVNINLVPHDELKKKTENTKAIIRTGENRPYANIILHSDVYFGSEV